MELSRYYGLTDAGLMAVAKSCPYIKTLNLDCTAIMFALGDTACTSNRGSSIKGFIHTLLQQFKKPQRW